MIWHAGCAKPDRSNALAEGILPDQGVCPELSGVDRRL